MGDFKKAVREMARRYAFLVYPPWMADQHDPNVWVDVVDMDSAARGDLIAGKWNIYILIGRREPT